jgi:hypothetical protein
MREIKIYVEGKGDLFFLSHFINHFYSYQFKIDTKTISAIYDSVNLRISIHTFTPLSGDGGINSHKIQGIIKEIVTSNIPIGIESILLIDADTPNHMNPKGGFNNRNAYLSEALKGTDVSYFIIPDNSSDGNLEDLVHNIISITGKQFYSCLCGYIDCLKTIKDNIPKGIIELKDFNKTKLDWYTYIMLGKEDKRKSAERNYSESGLWELTEEKMPQLKVFFDKIIYKN